MDKKIAEQVADVTRKMVASITSLQQVNEKTMKELAKQQMDAAEAFVDLGSRQLKGMGNVKTVQDVMTAQASTAEEVGKMMVGNAKRTMDLLTRSQEEIKQLIEKDLSAFVEQAKSGVK